MSQYTITTDKPLTKEERIELYMRVLGMDRGRAAFLVNIEEGGYGDIAPLTPPPETPKPKK